MKRVRIALFVALSALAAVSACNLQVSPQAAGDAVGTAVAQTMKAQTDLAVMVAGTLGAKTELANAVAGTLAAMASDTPVFTPTASLTPSPTLTLTPTNPRASVSVDTNCRTGPGKVYDSTGFLLVGQSAEVVGRAADSQYWVIRDPKDPTNICWLWGYYANVTGNTAALPVFQPPPTPTPAPGFTVTYTSVVTCGGEFAFRYQVKNTGSLTWQSIRIVATDNTTSTSFTHTRDSFKDYSGCAANGEQMDLTPGESAAVVGASPGELGYNPAGHSLSAAITLCSADALGGTCVSQTVSFTP
jgi:hypothetical protein